MRTHNETIRVCIELCRQCSETCQETFYNHCLDMGGAHVAHDHAIMMNDCIQACNTAADFMTRGSQHHQAECHACAEICDACAASCEVFDCDEMKLCAETCRRCARACRDMAHDHLVIPPMAAE